MVLEVDDFLAEKEAGVGGVWRAGKFDVGFGEWGCERAGGFFGVRIRVSGGFWRWG